MFFNPGNSNRTNKPLKTTLYSAYPDFKYTTQQWLVSDTEKLFYKNKNDFDKSRLLDKLGWTHDNVVYEFNSEGFRSDEFSYTSEKSIVFLGCSHVVGIGINYQDTMAYQVSKCLKSKCYNLGVGGGSIDSCFRFAYHWIPKLKPDIVILIQPDSARIEWYHKTKHFSHWITLLPLNYKRWPNYLNFYESSKNKKADGGIMRIGYQEGSKEPVAKKTMPLLDMDGQEMDLRDNGGFVPIGRMEKADDVPARLSKNEFVFTADAVRNAGDGDIDKGAEVMYNMMKNLEDGGNVSEESQGLEGARNMFQTAQRLEEVL